MVTKDSEHVLDVRQLAPALRHARIFETFGRLVPDAAFVLVNDHDPKPLYYQFQAELTGRFSWDYVEKGPEVWRVRIGRKQAAMLLTQPLRDEHKELLPHIEEIRTVANLVGETSLSTLRQQIDNVIAFLTHHLIPHAQAEDRVLYPIIGKAIGTVEALATMQFDHVEIGRITNRLALLRSEISDAPPNPSQIKDLREILYGLYALVKTHFVKEEEIFLPILDAKLTPAESQNMFEALEAAAAEAKSQIDH